MPRPIRETTPEILDALAQLIRYPRYSRVMTVIMEADHPLTTGQIADKLRKKKAHVSSVLVNLKKRGLVVASVVIEGRHARPHEEYSVPAEYRPHLVRIINSVQMLVNTTRTVQMPAEVEAQ